MTVGSLMATRLCGHRSPRPLVFIENVEARLASDDHILRVPFFLFFFSGIYLSALVPFSPPVVKFFLIFFLPRRCVVYKRSRRSRNAPLKYALFTMLLLRVRAFSFFLPSFFFFFLCVCLPRRLALLCPQDFQALHGSYSPVPLYVSALAHRVHFAALAVVSCEEELGQLAWLGCHSRAVLFFNSFCSQQLPQGPRNLYFPRENKKGGERSARKRAGRCERSCPSHGRMRKEALSVEEQLPRTFYAVTCPAAV